MSILKKITKSHRDQDSQKRTRLPKLFVLAYTTSTTVPNDEVNWTLEVVVTESQHHSSSPVRRPSIFANALKKEPSNTGAVEAKETERHYFFSSPTRPGHYTTSNAAPTVLRIFLCALTHPSTLDNVIEILKFTRPSTESLPHIQQSLVALQIASMIPSCAQGLDINKFCRFATSYLEDHTTPNVIGQEPVFVNYSKVVKDNQRLRSVLSPSNALEEGVSPNEPPAYSSIYSMPDEDMWTVPAKSKEPSKRGFWITYGSGAYASGRSRLSDEPRNVYGGLM